MRHWILDEIEIVTDSITELTSYVTMASHF